MHDLIAIHSDQIIDIRGGYRRKIEHARNQDSAGHHTSDFRPGFAGDHRGSKMSTRRVTYQHKLCRIQVKRLRLFRQETQGIPYFAYDLGQGGIRR